MVARAWRLGTAWGVIAKGCKFIYFGGEGKDELFPPSDCGDGCTTL